MDSPEFEILEYLPRFKESIDQKDLRPFWEFSWDQHRIKDGSLYEQKDDPRASFVWEFYNQHQKLKKFLTERFLVKLTPLFSLLSRNLDIAERFLRKGGHSPIEKIVQGVNSYLEDISNFVPLEKVARRALDLDVNLPLLICFTEDKDKAFIQVNGTLHPYFISFDILAKYFPNELVEAYVKNLKELEEDAGQPIDQLLFLVKEYGPVGPILLSRLFKKHPDLKDKTFIKYSLFRKAMVRLFPEDSRPLRHTQRKVCTIYDLIYSGKGIRKPVDEIKYTQSTNYYVVVLFQDLDYADNDSIKDITYKTIYPYKEVKDVVSNKKFDLSWMEKPIQAADAGISAEKDLLHPEKWVRHLWDFINGLGTDNPVLVKCAAYIAQYLMIHLADDFHTYGKACIESTTLSKKLYLLEKCIQENKQKINQEYKPSSLEYKVGSLLKDYETNDICLASLCLAYNKHKLTQVELTRGEEILEKIKQKCHDAHLSCTFPQS